MYKIKRGIWIILPTILLLFSSVSLAQEWTGIPGDSLSDGSSRSGSMSYTFKIDAGQTLSLGLVYGRNSGDIDYGILKDPSYKEVARFYPNGDSVTYTAPTTGVYKVEILWWPIAYESYEERICDNYGSGCNYETFERQVDKYVSYTLYYMYGNDGQNSTNSSSTSSSSSSSKVSDYSRAQQLYEDGNYLGAISILDNVIKSDSQNWLAYNLRGLAYSSIGDFEESILNYGLALQAIDGGDTENQSIILTNMAIDQMTVGEYNKAIQEVRNPMQLSNNEINYWILGRSYIGLDDYEGAVDILDEGISKYPDYVNLYYFRGIAYLWLGKYELALKDFQTSYRLDEDVFSLFWQVATISKLTEIDSDYEYDKSLLQQFFNAVEAEDDDYRVARITGLFESAVIGNSSVAIDSYKEYAKAPNLYPIRADIMYLELSIKMDVAGSSISALTETLNWYRDKLAEIEAEYGLNS